MNEDRCRNRFLVFMGKLNNHSYHVLDFHGNDNYDFIDVMYAYVDGLEPKVLGWIYNTISISVAHPSFWINEGYVEVLDKMNTVALEIVNYQVAQFKEFVADEIIYQ